MKQIWKGVMALATLLLAVACAPEEQRRAPEGDTNVTFNVTAPVNELGPGTRAMGDGLTATKLTVAVYDADGNYLPNLTINKDFKKQTVVELTLVTGKEYQIVFWAQSAAAPYAYDLENAQLDITYADTLKANNESLDAFWHMEKYTVEGAASESVKLLRPFAQLNVATSDYAKAVSAGVTIKQSKMKVENVYNTMDMLTGEVSGETSVALAMNNTPMDQGQKLAKYEDRAWLGMGYFLVGEKILVKTTFETEINDVAVKAWDNIPLQRNYRTNILGNLLTSTVDFNVVVDEVFAGAMDTTIWDGKSVKEPAKVDGKYQISDPAELAWLSAATNGTLGTKSAPYTKTGETTTPEPKDFAGETFVLTKDIDLLGNKWTPIGNSTNPFKGTFDGQDYKISNLVITGNKSNVGLFGFTTEGEIKNLVVENAKVSGRLNVAVVAGTPYTTKYTNITVQGHVEVNGMAYVGGVGGKNAYANWTNITVNVDETSYVNANSVENGTAYRTYVGGVCGFNGEGGHSFTNITSNINVKGSTIDVGGLFGIAHYGNKFENCSSSGDVEIYAAEEAVDAQEIGGIAGVWNNGGADVVFTNCKFTGTLKTNIEGVDFYYGGLIGKPYSATGKGKLIINGTETVSTLAQLQAALDAAGEGETTIRIGAGITGDVTVTQKADVKITIEGNDYKYAGVILVDGKSATLTTAGITIKNLNFEAETISADAIIRLGNGTNATRYTCNVTVDGCTFDVPGKVGVKSYTGGDKNLTITNCTVTEKAHSLVQAKGIDGILVNGCTVNSKNGLNFNNSDNVTVEACNVDVKGYAVRYGESSGGVGAAEKYFINNSTLKSACDDGDAVIILRGTADNSTLTITNTTLEGDITITNNAVDAKVIFDGYAFVKEGLFKDENGNYIVGNETALAEALKDVTTENINLTTGEFNVDFYSIAERKTLNIVGTEGTKVKFANLQVRASQFEELTIENCEIMRMPNKAWGHLVFGSSDNANGVYTIKNCTINGVGSQGIFINENTSGVVYNILDCTFNGDFGNEGAITIQNNTNVNHTVNVQGCTFNNIPESSHKIYIHYNYKGWTLNADNPSDVYWANPNI